MTVADIEFDSTITPITPLKKCWLLLQYLKVEAVKVGDGEDVGGRIKAPDTEGNK